VKVKILKRVMGHAPGTIVEDVRESLAKDWCARKVAEEIIEAAPAPAEEPKPEAEAKAAKKPPKNRAITTGDIATK